MKIKHLTLMAGPGGTFPAGAVREVDPNTGRQLVAGGYAVEIVAEAPAAKVPETADQHAPETAEAPAAKARRR